jgi:hypothetical protein
MSAPNPPESQYPRQRLTLSVEVTNCLRELVAAEIAAGKGRLSPTQYISDLIIDEHLAMMAEREGLPIKDYIKKHGVAALTEQYGKSFAAYLNTFLMN